MNPWLILVVLVTCQLGGAQVREEDQGGTMRKTMEDRDKLVDEGRVFTFSFQGSFDSLMWTAFILLVMPCIV